MFWTRAFNYVYIYVILMRGKLKQFDKFPKNVNFPLPPL